MNSRKRGASDRRFLEGALGRRDPRNGWLCLATALSLACSPAVEQPPAQAPTTKPTAVAPAQPPLHVALQGVTPAEPVLEVLPESVRKVLDEQVRSLAPDQKQLLLKGDDPVVATRPLLYLSAGGSELDLLALLFDSPHASNELVNLAASIDGDQDWVAIANGLATAAATELLRARLPDVAAGVERRREHLSQIAFAAAVLSRSDIERLALQELIQHFDEPAWHLALARLEARALQVSEAKAELAVLPSDWRGEGAAIVAEVTAAEALARADDAANRDEVVRRARLLLTLGRSDDVLQLLQPMQGALSSDLALATLQAQATSEASTCPSLVTPAIANEPLCQQAWAKLLEQHPRDVLTAAWASGQGRDAGAVEAYLGLVYVVPLMYGVTNSGKSADGAWIQHAFDAIAQGAKEATSVAAHFAAIAAVAEALGTAVTATLEQRQPGDPAAEKDRQALLARAAELVKTLPDDEWGQAAALGLTAMVSQHEPVYPVLRPLQGKVLPRYQTTFGELLLWDSLADGDAARLETLHQDLGDIAFTGGSSSEERSRWLVSWAESRAHLVGDAASKATLRKIVENLQDPAVGLELRLRASIDLAGLEAREGKLVEAAAKLEQIVESTPKGAVSSHAEQELLIAATGYLFVLRASSSSGSQRQEHIDQLAALLVDVGKAAAAPPTLQMWLALWRAHFDAVIAKEACNGAQACERRASKLAVVNREQLGRAIGKRSAALLARGVLPVGGVALELRYEGRGRLVPRVEVSPQFLMAHAPPL